MTLLKVLGKKMGYFPEKKGELYATNRVVRPKLGRAQLLRNKRANCLGVKNGIIWDRIIANNRGQESAKKGQVTYWATGTNFSAHTVLYFLVLLIVTLVFILELFNFALEN